MCDNQTNRLNNNLMKTYMTSIKAIAVVAGMLPALAGVAGITNTTNTYSFAEFGWSGGGVVDGSFTAVFPENATNITQTEVTAFSVTFTGNTNGDDFSIPLSGLGAMNFAINGSYNVTSGSLSASYPLDGGSANYYGSVTGTGNLTLFTTMFNPFPPPGFFIPMTTPLSNTSEPLLIPAPEPGTLALAGLGGATLLALRRKPRA